MIEAGWIAHDAAFAARDQSGFAARLLDERIDPDQPYLIPAMLSLVDVGQVDTDLVARMRETVERADGGAALEPGAAVVQRILSVRAAVLARQNDSDSMFRELQRQAERCAAKWRYERLNFQLGGSGAAAFAALANAAFAHASALPGSRGERMQAFGKGIRAIADGWPNALRASIGILDTVAEQLDVAAAGAVWPFLMELRRRP
jgi:hypothetical protein